jgi:flagellar M-ring protein FliF
VAIQDSVLSLRDGLKRFSGGFTSGQKVLTLVGVAIVAIASIYFMQLTSAPSYAPLFTNLSASDAASITTKLQAAGVPYQLAGGGTTIMVPQTQVYQERLDMAQAGLPANSTVGLSLLDKVGITSSQITQQADYQRALQGELATTIEAIQGVSSAQVNLALPPTDVFAISQNSQPTASVLVTLDSGTTLSQGQVQGIVHLVASSITNLSASNVTVVDQNGDVLSAPGFNNSAAQNSSATSTFDQSLAASLTSMLQNVVGINHVAVKVAAQMNFNQSTTKSQTVQTTKNGTPITVPTQTSKSTQTYTGTGTAPGGTLGSITQPAGANQNAKYNQTSSTSNYAVGQVNQTIQQAPGQIQHLSVAVLVDSKVKGVNLAAIKSLVSAAAGLQPKRGDTISVVRLPFAAQSATTALPAAAASSGSLMAMIQTGLLVLGVLIAIFLIVRSSKKEIREDLFIGDYEPPLALEPASVELSAPTLALPTLTPVVSEEVLDFIDRQPEDVAKLLRIWMNSRVKV